MQIAQTNRGRRYSKRTKRERTPRHTKNHVQYAQIVYKLVEAIATRNTEMAAEALRAHITEAGEKILENWRRQEAEQQASAGTAPASHDTNS